VKQSQNSKSISRRGFIENLATTSVIFSLGTQSLTVAELDQGKEAGVTVKQDQHINRALFDKLDKSINNGDGYKTGLGGILAWGESYIMLSYVQMYRATGDTYYLDKLVDHAEHVLAQRDDRRGFRDYSDRSRPAWSVGDKYTVAELILKDTQGKNVLKFRSTKYAYNNSTKIRVEKQPEKGHFSLFVENDFWKIKESYKNLVLDPTSADFVERRVNALKWVAQERDVQAGNEGSELLTVELLDPAADIPVTEGSLNLVPLVMAYHGYSGQCTYPMLEFAWLVRNNRKLHNKYAQQADSFVKAAEEVFQDAQSEWRDGPQPGEGYYVFGRRGCPFWSDNVGKPFNYLCGEARSLVRLAQMTGEELWQEQTQAIARLFKRHLRIAENGSYVWNYWWGVIEKGWDRNNSPSYNTPTYAGYKTVEDTSHGALEIEFAILCAQAGWVFADDDMQRFIKTFLENVVDKTKWTMNDRVDGRSGWGRHDAQAGRWADLAQWDPRVATAVRNIYEKQKIYEQLSGSVLLGVAQVLKWTDALQKN